MNEQELQLIDKYLRYVRKRRIIILFIVLLIISAGILLFKIRFNNINSVEENIVSEEILENLDNEILTNNISNSISNSTNEIQEKETKDSEDNHTQALQENEKSVEIAKPKEVISSERKEDDKPKTKPSNKDFLFTDGYTMENVTSAAHEYLKSSGYAGECIPLKDNEGIYIGMRVIFY